MKLHLVCLSFMVLAVSGTTSAGSGSVRIINGVYTTDYRAVVPLHIGNGSCSATLIGERTVLTSAHCFVHPDAEGKLAVDPSVTRGVREWRDVRGLDVRGAAAIQIGNYLIPVSWALVSKSAIGTNVSQGTPNDVAIVPLDSRLQGIPTIPLARTGAQVGETMKMVGYGDVFSLAIPSSVASDQPKDKLLEMEGGVGYRRMGSNQIDKVENGVIEFRGRHVPRTTDQGVEPDGADASIAPGDSGGPLIREANGRRAVVGVASVKGVQRFHQWLMDTQMGQKLTLDQVTENIFKEPEGLYDSLYTDISSEAVQSFFRDLRQLGVEISVEP